VFNDLGKLRREHTEAPTHWRRSKLQETFARIPHDRAQALAHRRICAAAWVILIELDRLILKERGRNPVRLTNYRLKPAGIARDAKARALHQLEAAGAVRVLSRGKDGRSPLVLHRWFPRQD
jgi:hypothetical protein